MKTVLDSTTEVTGFIPFGFKLFNLHAPKEQQHFSASVHTHRTRLTSKRKWQVRICYGIGGMLAIAAIVQFAIFPNTQRTNKKHPSSTETQAGQHHPNPILTSPVKNPADAPDKATTSPEIPNNSLQPLHPRP